MKKMLLDDPNSEEPQNEPTPNQDPATEPSQSLDEVYSRLDSLNEKLSKLDEIEQRLSNQPNFQPTQEEAGYVPKGWEPKDYNDFFKVAEEIADKKAEAKLTSFQEQQKKAEEERIASEKRINEEYDRQMADLEKSGKIPAIKDNNDPKDPGRIARQELLNLYADYPINDLTKLADLRIKLRKQPAGGAAPVGSSNNITDNTQGAPTYEEIHTKSLAQLARESVKE